MAWPMMTANRMLTMQGVLINPGWDGSGPTGPAATGSLAKLPIPRLCPIGFVFIWVQKQHISAVVRQMGKWGFAYVENLTWVFLHRNHSILRLPSEYVQRSHLTLFLFRKEGQKACPLSTRPPAECYRRLHILSNTYATLPLQHLAISIHELHTRDKACHALDLVLKVKTSWSLELSCLIDRWMITF